MGGWLALLDALEERTARLSAALDAGSDLPDLGEVELRPEVPLPPELRLRTAALLAETQRVESRLAQRRGQLQRAQAYAST